MSASLPASDTHGNLQDEPIAPVMQCKPLSEQENEYDDLKETLPEEDNVGGRGRWAKKIICTAFVVVGFALSLSVLVSSESLAAKFTLLGGEVFVSLIILIRVWWP